MTFDIAYADSFQFSELSILPIIKPTNLDVKKISLGRSLFYEKKLSSNNEISCADCHHLASGGADSHTFSLGVGGAKTIVNTPTVYNTMYNLAQFWDGRANTLEDQINQSIKDPLQMASHWSDIVKKLQRDATYAQRFKKIYGEDELTASNIKDAIATFERSLVTPNAPFDLFLAGNDTAISSNAKKGFELFQSYGCASCHQGANVGSNMFQTMGVFGDYFKDRGNITDADLGRFSVTDRVLDKYKFKVPSLRLVVLTAPYFHDGSIDTLVEAIQIMVYYQLGRMISDDDIQLIIDFLQTLKGDLQSDDES